MSSYTFSFKILMGAAKANPTPSPTSPLAAVIVAFWQTLYNPTMLASLLKGEYVVLYLFIQNFNGGR